MFPESYMVGSHLDDVAEAKTGGLEMRRHKLEGIPKLRFGIIGERLVWMHAGYSREKHKFPRVQDRREMPLAWNLGEFAGYQHFVHDSSRHNSEMAIFAHRQMASAGT